MNNPSLPHRQTMRDGFDSESLAWLSAELRTGSQRFRQDMRAAAAPERDPQARVASLRDARGDLQQARAALRIVDTAGLALVFDAAEAILDRIDTGKLRLTAAVTQEAADALHACAAYVDELRAGTHAQPLRLYPYYRSLLVLLEAERIHPADLLFPTAPPPAALGDAGPAPILAPEELTLLRKRFEEALLRFLKSPDRMSAGEQAAAMGEIIGGIAQGQQEQPARSFWRVLQGFAERVAADGAGDGQNQAQQVRQLFAQINLQLRRVAQGQSLSINAERVLKDALFFIARSDAAADTPLVARIRSAYRLDGLVPDAYEEKRYGRVDDEALRQAQDHLARAKDAWDRIADGDADMPAATAFTEEMQRLAALTDRLKTPALAALLHELAVVSKQAAHIQPWDDLGLEVATGLLFVENTLENIGNLPANAGERAEAMTRRLAALAAEARTGNGEGGGPVADDTAADDPAVGDPVAGKPVAGKPVAGKPVAGISLSGMPMSESPAVEEDWFSPMADDGAAPSASASLPQEDAGMPADALSAISSASPALDPAIARAFASLQEDLADFGPSVAAEPAFDTPAVSGADDVPLLDTILDPVDAAPASAGQDVELEAGLPHMPDAGRADAPPQVAAAQSGASGEATGPARDASPHHPVDTPMAGLDDARDLQPIPELHQELTSEPVALPAAARDLAHPGAIHSDVARPDAARPDAARPDAARPDADLLPIFLDEGREALSEIGRALRAWRGNPDEAAWPQALLRHLHTFKGSARVAGALTLGQQAHAIETQVAGLAQAAHPAVADIDALLPLHERALELFAELQAAAPGVATPLVRVRADILDRLSRQADKAGLLNAKLDAGIAALQKAVAALTDNLAGMQQQMHEIESRAGEQLAARMSITGSREFNPAEFDRLTKLREVALSMAHSVAAVGDLRQSLGGALDKAAIDIAMQARLNADLRQNLARTRMARFAGIAERLYRVAFQTAREAGKRIELGIVGGATEIDRKLLEKIPGPLEHLLRNAIVHGIESAEDRRAAGKKETGELTLEVRQESGETVIQVADDGRGLNLHRIRRKAVQQGLLAADAALSDAEARELIFLPGFSTMDEISGLAGRGMGLDAVRAEVDGLGGRISVYAENGRGTHFTIRVPASPADGAAVVPVSSATPGKAGARGIVMVADDSPAVRRATQRLLARAGYEAVLARDGLEALEQLQTVMPDLVLIDVEMPRLDGMGLLRTLRGDVRMRAIPVVMISSRTSMKHRDEAAVLGVRAYLGKPYRDEELMELIGELVR